MQVLTRLARLQIAPSTLNVTKSIATSSRVKVEDFERRRPARRLTGKAREKRLAEALKRKDDDVIEQEMDLHDLPTRLNRRRGWLFRHHGQLVQATKITVRAEPDNDQALTTDELLDVLRDTTNLKALSPDSLDSMVSAVQQRLSNKDASPETIKMLKTVVEALMRQKELRIIEPLVTEYTSLLKEGELVDPDLWATLIKAEALENRFDAAKMLFQHWHLAYKNCPSMSDKPLRDYDVEPPWLAILYSLRRQIPTGRDIAEPLYGLVESLVEDKVPKSTAIYNALLDLELARCRFRSFWGLWQKAQNEVRLNNHSWRLAAVALAHEKAVHKRHLRNKSSMLPQILSFEAENTPNRRFLFARFVQRHVDATRGEPNLELVYPIATTANMNAFLRAFTIANDYLGAALVVQAFEWMDIKPDLHTHNAVNLVIVKAWSRGMLKQTLEESKGLSRGDPEGWIKMIMAITARSKTSQEKDPERVVLDLSYLLDLLRRCQGWEPARWDDELSRLTQRMKSGFGQLGDGETSNRPF